jgi:hypothetical protein
VWRLDVDRRTLVFLALRPDGAYAPVAKSRAFPELDPSDVLAQLQLAEGLVMSRWVIQLDDWVRDVILSRRGS